MKTRSDSIVTFTLLLALVAGLGACGGGGGGGGGVAVPTDPINITSDNAVQVASVTLAATDILSGVNAGPIFGAASVTGTGTAPTSSRTGLADFVSLELRRLQPLVPAGTAAVQIAVAFPPQTVSCFVSGTLTVSGNIADTTFTTLTAGDTLNATFSNCDDGDGVVINGTLSLNVQAFTGNLDFPPYSVTVLASFTNLSLAEAGNTLTVNGAATLVESTQDNILITSSFSGSSVSFSETAGDRGKLTDFVFDGTDNVNTLEYTADASGTLATVNLGGSVQFQTTTTFAGTGADYPSTGVMVITGAGNSSETITVGTPPNLTIDVDADGDGTIDQTIPTTWDAL